MIEMTLTIGDILTPAEIKKVRALYDKKGIAGFANECCDKIIKPNIERINKKIGQECDPKFLAYAVEYALLQASKGK